MSGWGVRRSGEWVGGEERVTEEEGEEKRLQDKTGMWSLVWPCYSGGGEEEVGVVRRVLMK